MRASLLLVLLLLSGPVLRAQGRVRTIETDSGRVVLHHFTTGQVSTREWTDKDGRFGRSLAYKRDGTVIVDHHTRRIAGHASVHFEYHPNGAVSRSEFSDAPDAGIQWYRSTTTFDDQGNRTGFSEQGHDDLHVIPHPGTTFTAPVEPFGPTEEPVREPEVAICQKLFVNEVFVVNSTRETAVIRCTPKHPSPALPAGEHLLTGGDTLRLGSYTIGERFIGPEEQLELRVMEAMYLNQMPREAVMRTHQADRSKEHRTYTLEITGWTLTAKDHVEAQGTTEGAKPDRPVRRWWKPWTW
ncbi:MAG: hypothetical protein JNL05_15220 [Flavobacteriales bacterium]|nr:hypothetical protein [Flavobacteriales bacterium]